MITTRIGELSLTYDSASFKIEEDAKKGLELLHLAKNKKVTIEKNTIRLVELSDSSFISIKKSSYGKEFCHFYINDKNWRASIFELNIKTFEEIENNGFLLSFMDDERRTFYNPRYQVSFTYPFVGFQKKIHLWNGKKVYIGYVRQEEAIFKIYFTMLLQPIMVQNKNNKAYKRVTVLEGETEKEALDRVLFSLKKSKELKRTYGKNKL